MFGNNFSITYVFLCLVFGFGKSLANNIDKTKNNTFFVYCFICIHRHK